MKNWMVKSFNGCNLVPMETALYESRKVFLEDEISMETANGFMKEIIMLSREDSKKPVTIYVNSPGGDVRAGFLIIDLMRSVPMELNVVCAGMAASMAGVIMACGARGHRYAFPHSMIMLHEPRMFSGANGAVVADLERTAQTALRVKGELVDALMTATSKDREEVERAMAYDNYMTAQEAKEFGIIDEVISKLSEGEA